MSQSTSTLILGPAGAVDPQERITTLVESVLGRAQLQPTAIEVAQRNGHDIPRVLVDVTGAAVDSLDAFESFDDLDDVLPDGMELTDRFDPMHASPGLLRNLRIEAHPLLVLGVAADLEGQLLDLPIEWVEDVEGRLGLSVDDERADAEVSGRARLAASQQAVIDAIQPTVDRLLDEAGRPFAVEILQVQLTQEGVNRIRMQVLARAAKGILSAKARAEAIVEVDRNLVLHVRDLDISSKNLVIAAGLKMAESKLVMRSVDLRSHHLLGARLQTASLTVGDEIVLEATLG